MNECLGVYPQMTQMIADKKEQEVDQVSGAAAEWPGSIRHLRHLKIALLDSLGS